MIREEHSEVVSVKWWYCSCGSLTTLYRELPSARQRAVRSVTVHRVGVLMASHPIHHLAVHICCTAASGLHCNVHAPNWSAAFLYVSTRTFERSNSVHRNRCNLWYTSNRFMREILPEMWTLAVTKAAVTFQLSWMLLSLYITCGTGGFWADRVWGQITPNNSMVICQWPSDGKLSKNCWLDYSVSHNSPLTCRLITYRIYFYSLRIDVDIYIDMPCVS